MVYGEPAFMLKFHCIRRFLTNWLLNVKLNRCGMSCDAVPHSCARLPVAGMANAPSELFSRFAQV